MLEMTGLCGGYGSARVLQGVNLSVAPGEILCLMGRNGAGKSTTLKAIMGLVRAEEGRILLGGTRIDSLPAHHVPKTGIAWVPQGRRLFSELTVAENLEIGLVVQGHGAEMRARVLDLFPRLRERLGQVSGTLSGGEQQMLAIGRALATGPRILLLDEPTEGLQPSLIDLIRTITLRLRAEGMAIILVESHVEAALALADRITFIENGRSPETVATKGLTPAAPQFAAYVGV